MTKKTKDEARSWLWTGIMCVFMALVTISLFFLIPEEMSGEPTGYALAAIFFTVGCLIIVFRNNIAQWGTGETSRPSGEAIADWREKERPKMAKKTNDEVKLQANSRIGNWRLWKAAPLFTIVGIVALVAAYAIVRLVIMQPVFESGPLLGIRIALTILTLIFVSVGAISTGIGLALLLPLLVGAYIQEWQGKDVRTAAAKALDRLGWQPKTDEMQSAYQIAKGDWDTCVRITTAEEANAAWKQANEFYDQGDFQAAIRLYTLLLESNMDVNRPVIKEARAMACCKAGLYEQAEQDLVELLDILRMFRPDVSGSKVMYWYLVARYRGDEQKAMEEWLRGS